ncbi:MAG: enoyl-CoA hydratase/isomerase family protein [Desulfobacterales bacterium]|nr:enoyl-CoA hydratase/isomerase family protein [Desulfobacterales bacterium]
MTENKPILVERKDHIGVITLNRPGQMNTFTVEFAGQLNDALVSLDADDDIRVVVVQGAGRAFSVGIELDCFKNRTHDEYRELIRQMDAHNHTIARMKKPVMASVGGYAVANGAGLVFACDLAVAAESAKFGTTAVNVGLICLGPAVPMARSIGRKKTLEMVLSGDMITAAEAERLGLINRVVPDDALEAETMAWAEKLAQKSPLSLRAGKTGIYGMSDLPYHQALDYLGEIFAALCATEDAQEGLSAFEEKRKPVWKLR